MPIQYMTNDCYRFLVTIYTKHGLCNHMEIVGKVPKVELSKIL